MEEDTRNSKKRHNIEKSGVVGHLDLPEADDLKKKIIEVLKTLRFKRKTGKLD